ncbi:hypothetical protein AVO45_12550 [Ruegeria marisrubri]|uniref:Secreted protein n=1 Tax=Ruegeria marisrubri TaxID=1685379 RepID=A0A0X3TM93_9RHOB|nr:hypothetical protein [Ruegeria marisrubri]KUJ76141.1 hypothetical protein AVO45_12550 [Ruegeria marisrubri]
MRHFLNSAICAVAVTAFFPTPAPAATGDIKSACLATNRPEATRQRCTCIQDVADGTLSPREQRTIAKWFRDPHQAQTVKMSKSAHDDALWDRYETFGQLAQAACR